MIVMQEKEEVVDKRENKRFRATHGEMVVEVRVLVENLPMVIVIKASYYVILDAKVDTICFMFIVISLNLVNIHATKTIIF